MADPGTWLVFSRRSFLRYSAWSAGLVALSQLRTTPGAAVAVAKVSGLRVLTPRDAETMTVITERMVFNGDPAMPAVRQTDAIETIDQALLQLDPGLQTQLRWLLRVFEWGPPVFTYRLTTFTGMNPEAKDAYLQSWAVSESEMRRLAFRALKNLAMLGYYSQDATWKAIHYDGPWVPRPRRAVAGQG